jgi:hypothetical protein
LIVLNRQKMRAMGASDAQAQALIDNRWFSLSVLTELVTELERLGRVAGRPEVLALAATAKNEEEARFLAAAVRMLAHLDVSGVPIRRVTGRGTVVGFTPDGAVVVPAPVDYVSWTEKVGGFAMRADLRATRRAIWVTGPMSGAAQQGFAAREWTLHDVTALAGAR